MAKRNSTTHVQTPDTYWIRGQSYPISSLTNDFKILDLARRLHRQWKLLDEMHQRSHETRYKPFRILKKFR